MRAQDIKVAESLFQRALELEGYSGYVLSVDGGQPLDFISSVASEQGGLASLMMASDRIAVMQYGMRLWSCGYVKSDATGDGVAASSIEDFSSREAAESYRAIESIDPKSEIGLSLMVARDAVSQVCEKSENGIAKLNPVPGFFFGFDPESDAPEIPFENVSDIIAYGWRSMMLNNRELVLTLGNTPEPDQSLDVEAEPTANPK